MSAPPLPPAPSVQKPSSLASCILLGLILGGLGLVGGGGFWAYKTFFSKPKAEASVAAVPFPAPPPHETSPTAPPPAPVSPPVTPNPPDAAPSSDTPPLTAAVGPGSMPTPVPPGVKKEPTPPPAPPPEVVAATPTPTPTATPPPDVVPDAANPDPVVKEEPVASFAENAPEVASLKADADRRIEEAPPEIYSDADKQKVREAIRLSKRLSRVATLQFGKGSAKLGSRETVRFKKALLTPEAENLLSDPQAVLFVIGYADATGTSQTNRQISQVRASGVGEVLKSFKIPNKCYSVGIGSTSLISAAEQEKNRAVEVWIVLP